MRYAAETCIPIVRDQENSSCLQHRSEQTGQRVPPRGFVGQQGQAHWLVQMASVVHPGLGRDSKVFSTHTHTHIPKCDYHPPEWSVASPKYKQKPEINIVETQMQGSKWHCHALAMQEKNDPVLGCDQGVGPGAASNDMVP